MLRSHANERTGAPTLKAAPNTPGAVKNWVQQVEVFLGNQVSMM